MTVQDFLKLEKVEYGGVKGTMLSEVTEGMFAEFNDLYKTFTDSSYDPLDLSDDVRMTSTDTLIIVLCCSSTVYFQVIIHVRLSLV